MSWDITRTHYLDKMQGAAALLDRARDLQAHLGADLPPKIGQKLEDLAPQLTRQLTRLRDNQFHVAVLGLEKAGKSALINAWLGAEILPSMDPRCTYTTTEIWSAPENTEQLYMIEYRTPEEFDRELEQKRETAAGLARGHDLQDLENDLEETARLEPKIRPLLGRVPLERSFRDVREIRGELTRTITDPAHARAVRRIVVRTVALRAARDIVFHDVPGFNSPVEMHKQQARQKIAECDAILYAKDFRTPDREGTEVLMLKLADAEDPYIRAAGKTFVVLTRIDSAEDVEHYRQSLDSARRVWQEIPAERVLPVCPPACLFLAGTGREEVMRFGANIVERLKKLGVGDGIAEVKSAVQAYIDNERTTILTRRCDALLADLRKVSRALIDRLEDRYPEFSGNYEELEKRRFDIAFNNWWTGEWKRIRKEIRNLFDLQVRPRIGEELEASPSENADLARFREYYRSLTGGLSASLPSSSQDKIHDLYRDRGVGPDGGFRPVEAHIAIRNELNQEATERIDELGRELSADLSRAVLELTGKIMELLWNIDGVEDELARELGPVEPRIEHGISTLFLRFARPVVEIFLTAPRGVPDRRLRLRERMRDVKALAEFYEGPDAAHKNLEHFLETGVWQRPDSATPPNPPPATMTAAAEAGPPTGSQRMQWVPLGGSAAGSTPGNTPMTAPAIPSPSPPTAASSFDPADDFDSIFAEVQEDLLALDNYLKNSVFGASGFEPYWHQELSRVWKMFEHLEESHRRWSAYVRDAYRRGVPAVVAAAPQLGNDAEFDRQVAQSLSQLKQTFMALENRVPRPEQASLEMASNPLVDAPSEPEIEPLPKR